MRKLLLLPVLALILGACGLEWTPQWAENGCTYEMTNPPEAWHPSTAPYLRVVDFDVRNNGGAWQDISVADGVTLAPNGFDTLVYLAESGTNDFDLDVEWVDSAMPSSPGHHPKHYAVTRTC